jgi:thiamine-phosphate pyrophosphorylase
MINVYRIIDANLNRASEGLRVLEEIFRFIEEDPSITNRLKKLRHFIRTETKSKELLNYRSSETDIGKDSFSFSEKKRDSLEHLFFANSKRIQESLRVLEEFYKPVNEGLAYSFKKFRFEIYNIESDFFGIKRKFRGIIKDTPQFYGIIDTRFSKKNHIEICRELINGDIKIIQLREKELKDKELLKIARKLSQICKDNEVLFIVNDRVDIAYLSDASGVHIGQDDLEINDVKKIIGFKKIIGKSTHNLEQVREAFEKKPDYIGFGPIFSTKSKENPDPVVGIENLKKVKEEYPQFPVVAIGGINISNINNVVSCRPDMISVMSGFISKNHISEEIKKYRRIINDTNSNS